MRGKKPREWQGFDRISKCIFFLKNTIKACVQFFLAIVSVLVKHITHLRDFLNRLIFECRGQIKNNNNKQHSCYIYYQIKGVKAKVR